jgi:hypothetical protein
MTIEEYVEILKPLVPLYFVENTKDWSASDKMYIFLHNIQLKKMEEFKEMLKSPKRVHEYSSRGNG